MHMLAYMYIYSYIYICVIWFHDVSWKSWLTNAFIENPYLYIYFVRSQTLHASWVGPCLCNPSVSQPSAGSETQGGQARSGQASLDAHLLPKDIILLLLFFRFPTCRDQLDFVRIGSSTMPCSLQDLATRIEMHEAIKGYTAKEQNL